MLQVTLLPHGYLWAFPLIFLKIHHPETQALRQVMPPLQVVVRLCDLAVPVIVVQSSVLRCVTS